MIPPSRPNITRLTDSSVMVRWAVPPNNGLPIQFFKVQYRELTRGAGSKRKANGNGARSRGPQGKGSRWRTNNEDIPPHIRSYEVDDLKTDSTYKSVFCFSNVISSFSISSFYSWEPQWSSNKLISCKLSHYKHLNSTKFTQI